MQTYTLSIGEHSYALDPDADIAEFQSEMTEIIRRGGGMIDVPTMGPERVSALASPGLPIVFEARSREVDPSADDSETSVTRYLDEFDWDGF